MAGGTDQGEQVARSLYAGLRVTLTDPQNGSPGILTVSGKDRLNTWDDWSSIVPAIRVPTPTPIGSNVEAIRRIIAALETLIDQGDDL